MDSSYQTPVAASRAPADAGADDLARYANLKLAALGQPAHQGVSDPYFLDLAGPLLRNYHQKDILLAGLQCPVNARIQGFLDSYLADCRPDGATFKPINAARRMGGRM